MITDILFGVICAGLTLALFNMDRKLTQTYIIVAMMAGLVEAQEEDDE